MTTVDYKRLANRVLELYRRESRGTRFHVWGRARSLDMTRILEALPTKGTLFDLGCGHGFFGFLAQLWHPALTVVGRDVSEEKVRIAKRVCPPDAPVEFSLGTGIPQQPDSLDAVSILDVLQYIPLEDWDELFAAVHAALRPGGVLLLKTHDPSRRLKYMWNKLHENLTTSWNKTHRRAVTFKDRGWFTEHLGAAGFAVEVVRMDRGTPYSHVLFDCRKAAVAAARSAS